MSAAGPVYDPEQQENSIKPSAPKSKKPLGVPSLPGIKSQEQKGSLFNPGSGGTGSKAKDNVKKAKSAAKDASSLAQGVGAAITGDGFDAGRAVLSIAKRHKKELAGGGLLIFCIILVIAGFLAIIPMKIQHTVDGLTSRFFGTSEDAQSKASDKLVSRYIKNKVLPGYEKCGSTVNRKCSAVVDRKKNNPVSKMYTAWSDNRLEEKLAKKGIEFEKKDGTWKMKYTKYDGGKGVDIGRNGENIEKEMTKRSEIRAAVRESLEKETRWKQVMYRYRVGRLLETKYGIKRCIVFCGAKDSFAEKKAERKVAAKLYIVERVITPRNKNLGVVFSCLLSSNCDEKLKNEPGDKATDPATEGEPRSEIEKETRIKMQSNPGEFGDLNKQIEIKDGIEKDGYTKWLAKSVLGDILGETTSKIASKSVPVIGWINFASDIVHYGKNGGKTIRHLIYLSNAPAAVSLFMQYKTYSDEIHTGKKDNQEVGSFVSSLGPNSRNSNMFDKNPRKNNKLTSDLSAEDAKDEVKGGVAGAEQTPYYQALMGGKNTTTSTAAFLNPLNPVAFAATTSSKKTDAYRCNDGKPVPKGELICPEEKLGQGIGPLDTLQDILNSPWLAPLTGALGVWHDTVGKVFEVAGGLVGDAAGAAFGFLDKFCGLPGNEVIPVAGAYCALRDPISNAIKELADAITNSLIPNPFSANMSGGRTFNMMAAGANVAGNDACSQMGCGAVDKKFVADVINERQKEELRQFRQKPIYARVFDGKDEYSLVSRVAMAIPFSYGSSAQNSFANLMSNPLGGLFSSFGNLFSSRYSYAAANEKTVDAFNIGTVGFPANAIPDDLEAYWDNNDCEKNIEEWQKAAAEKQNDQTGMPVHEKPNVCLLIKNSVANMGGFMDSSLLSDDDKKHVGSSGSGSSSATDTASETIDMANLYKDSSNIACAAGSRDIGVQDGYHAGQKVKVRVCAIDEVPETGEQSELRGANGKLLVNSRLSAFYVKLIKDAKQGGTQGISAQEGFRTMSRQQQLFAQYGSGRAARPGYSNHQMGLAVDWSDGMIGYLQKNPHGLKATVSGEPWHWSPTGN